MPMDKKGLTKLIEECSELIQIAAKKSAFLNVDDHPDGSHMPTKLIEEIGDVKAALYFVTHKLNLSDSDIAARMANKLKTYYQWDEE